jgi:hypothetical protein
MTAFSVTSAMRPIALFLIGEALLHESGRRPLSSVLDRQRWFSKEHVYFEADFLEPPLPALRAQVLAPFFADAVLAAVDRPADARPLNFPPFFDGALLVFLPRPEPLFLPLPELLLPSRPGFIIQIDMYEIDSVKVARSRPKGLSHLYNGAPLDFAWL